MNIIMLLSVCPLPHRSKEGTVEATVSKVILLKMVEQILRDEVKHATIPLEREVCERLNRLLRKKLQHLHSISIVSPGTMISYFSPTKADDAVK